jgi:TonB family protein
MGKETRLNAQETALGRYLARLDRNIRLTWVLPLELRAMGAQGNVEITFDVNRWGRVSNAKINRKSGNPQLDQVALKAIPKRFHRIPRKLDQKELHISYLFRSTDFLIVESP